MNFRLLSLLLFCLPLTSHAAVLQAEARAASKEQAQRQALSDLANSIFVQVQSESSSDVQSESSGGVNGSVRRKDEMHVKSSSDIPLIGAEINCDSLGREVVCKVSLESSKSLALYGKKLHELLAEIGALEPRIAKAMGSERYALLTQALTLIEQYEKYRTVAQQLGATQFAPPPRSRGDTEAQLRELEKATSSIDIAAQALTKGLKAEAVYIYPALPNSSSEITPFASVVRDHLAAKLSPVASAELAKTFFKGEYEILDDGIHLSYRLLDMAGNTLATRVVKLAPEAYRGLQVKPATLALEKLLGAGLAENGDFRAQLSTKRGSEALLFNEHEEVELLVKLNRPGYFYVVGHVLKTGENHSYLLELEEADSNRRFVRYVGADDANKWLSIGKFEAAAPFGVDSLQLIASQNDPLKKANDLPSYNLDSKTGLYIIAASAQEGITKTRAIIRKKEEQEYRAVAKLMFTTMAKGQ